MIELEVHGSVRLLRMTGGENRLDRAFVDDLSSALDEVESVDGPCALVTTGAGKFYSERARPRVAGRSRRGSGRVPRPGAPAAAQDPHV